MSRKTIVISEDGMFASEPLTFADVLQLTCSCVAGVAGNVLAKAEGSDEYKKIEDELFDTANLAFSNCLAHAFPGQELRPDLTEEAILRAENDILSERAAEVEPDAGEVENIVPFPKRKVVDEFSPNPEPAGTYDPRECGHVSDPEDVMPEKGE